MVLALMLAPLPTRHSIMAESLLIAASCKGVMSCARGGKEEAEMRRRF
jgi:hypothetical protein